MQHTTHFRHLYLMRNGQTIHPKCILSDFSRTLSARGLQQTIDISQQIKQSSYPMPDCVLCSSATRSMQTLELLIPLFPRADIFYRDTLYLAPKERLEQQINNLSNQYQTLLIIAHNNGLQNLLNCLINTPMHTYKLPLSACAMLTLHREIYWRNLCQGTAELNTILRPKINAKQ